MKSSIVILGAGGRLGAALTRQWQNSGQNSPALSSGISIRGLTRSELDLADPLAVENFCRDLSGVQWLVNCAGATNLEACEANPQLAWQVNADAVGHLARACSSTGTRLLHFSTDYVFDGKKQTPYLESDPTEPLGVYAASKQAGEAQVLAADPAHVVARVSWVFGPDRPAFPDFMLDRARRESSLSAVADKWACPTYTLDVADWLRPFLLEDNSELPGGLYHLCNSGVCTWQEYAQAALDAAAALGCPLQTQSVLPAKMSDMTPWTAPRPVFTAMNTEKFAALCPIPLRSWTEALQEHIARSIIGS